ncbi:UNVERIFIED_CONTAM: hypothetical protein HDU68_009385 [Siphonaria sp. JEL0065]|nr:hypothetical protein HDU68_009385 [Siphonaria sp. JEL0065]
MPMCRKQILLQNARATSFEELFNLRHAVLRNVIERIFGCLYMCFPILKSMRYSLELQRDLTIALAILFNIIRSFSDTFDDEPLEFDEFEENVPPQQGVGDADVDDWRDSIATAMWSEYEGSV